MAVVGVLGMLQFAVALGFALLGSDPTFKIQMGQGAYGIAGMVVGYYFGSSAGSDRKTDLLNEKDKA